jgi:hypothetical protein
MMWRNRMFLLLVISLAWLTGAQAQKEYFVYLQTEDLTPFYIKLQGRTVSSTASGYLIVGKLTDSIYPIKLGVLGTEEVQDYGIKVAGRNAGYLVKKVEGKGWGIVDLQTNETQMNMEWSSALEDEANRKKFEAAEMQQRAADSAKLVVAAPVVPVAVAPDSVGKPNTETAIVPAKDSNTAVPVVVKTEEQRLADSIALVIAAKEKEIKALQEALASATAAKTGTVATAAKTTTDSKSATATVVAPVVNAAAADSLINSAIAKTGAEKSPVFLDMEMGGDSGTMVKKDTLLVTVPASKTDSLSAAKADTARPALPATDSLAAKTNAEVPVAKMARMPCTSFFSREELTAIMDKAAKISDRDEMVAFYKSAFADNCVTTSHLKKIAATMASDVARYQVLEAAWPHTLDYYAFGELSSLLKDPYYLQKFKTLIQQ